MSSQGSPIELLAVMVPASDGGRRVSTIVRSLWEARGYARGYCDGIDPRPAVGIRSVDWTLADEEEEPLLATTELTGDPGPAPDALADTGEVDLRLAE